MFTINNHFFDNSIQINIKLLHMIIYILLSNLIYIYIYIYIYICEPTYLSICLSIYLSIYLSVYLSIYLSVYLSIYSCSKLPIKKPEQLSKSFSCFKHNFKKQPPKVFSKKAVFKKFTIFIGKHLCWSHF